MSKRAMSNDTSKPINTYINVKIVHRRCQAWLNTVKEETGRNYQEELTNAYLEYIDRHYAITSKHSDIENNPERIIRCKDCKMCKYLPPLEEEGELVDGKHYYCGRFDTYEEIHLDDYCSYGERRETE